MKKKGSRGFTLVEMIVVIAIIAILMAIVLANLEKARSQNRDKVRIADISKIQLDLALYLNKNGAYPIGSDIRVLTAALTPDYTSTIPVDPLNTGNYVYSYADDGTGGSYCLSALLENPSAYIDTTVYAACNKKPYSLKLSQNSYMVTK